MRYRLLGPASLRVSEVGLGTMTFGEAWGWGAAEADCGRLLDLYLEAGGNFVDTASNYTDGQSEEILGRLLAGRREHVILATKYSLTADPDDPNAGGNHRRSLVGSIERSLRRLRTDRVDLLWLHMYDGLTPIEESLRALDDLVTAGKVLHIGVSDAPAWVVARGAAVAELRGWSRPTALQVPYGPASRDVELELLPMARSQGLGVVAWGVLKGGILTGKYGTAREPRRYGDAPVSEANSRRAERLAELAASAGATPAQLALAWVMDQGVIPLLGARTPPQLEENLGCLAVRLDADLRLELDRLAPPPAVFPSSFLAEDDVVELIFGRTRPAILA